MNHDFESKAWADNHHHLSASVSLLFSSITRIIIQLPRSMLVALAASARLKFTRRCKQAAKAINGRKLNRVRRE